MPSNTFSEPPLIAEINCVLGCIKSFPKGTSCGRDGLRAQHILDALCGEGSATATSLIKAITLVINLWLAGRCPPILAEFVASAPFTPLLKPDNGIRPIEVGTIWRRLVSMVAMKGVGKEMSKYLGDFQFGVGVSGGAEAVLHSANRVLSEYHNDGSLAMLTVDFSNAFNLVDRSALLHEVRVRCPSISLWVDFLYGQATRLYIGDTHIWSATGVQQGDPLGPLLFALVLHPLIHKIRDSCKLLLHAWYLDDGTVIGDSEEVSRVLDIIKVSGPGLGLELNIKKTEIFWPSCNGTKLREGLFPVDIRRPSLGVKLLGGAVSRDADFISGLAMRRAANAVDLMSLLPQLHDPQSELLLLRSCMGQRSISGREIQVTSSRPSYANGNCKAYYDSRLVRSFSPPPAAVEPSATPPHPKFYMGEEAPQSQDSFAYPQENNNRYNSYGQDNGFGPASIYQSNGKGSAPWWQQKNARVTELNPEENKAEYHGLSKRTAYDGLGMPLQSLAK
ncbi:putative reverse transcriptase domain-containing protein [Tanacetum coccineum]